MNHIDGPDICKRTREQRAENYIKGKNILLIFFFSILVHIVSELAIHLLNVRAKVEKQLEIVPQGKKTLIYFL